MLRKFIRFLLLISILIVGLPIQAQDCSAQDVEAWKTQANNDYDLENYEEAIVGYTCMIEVSDEQDAYAYQWRGVTKNILGQLSEALIDVTESIRIDPTRGTAYFSRGNIYIDLEEYELALEDFTSAIENGYDTPGSYNNRGYIYWILDDHESAKREYQMAISVDSEYGLGYSNLGETYFDEGDMALALDHYEKALQYSEGRYRSYPYRSRGLMFFMMQDYLQAIRDFNQAIEANPDEPEFYLARAETYRATNSPNAYADYLRYIQSIQTEVIDIELTDIGEPLEMVEGRVYRLIFDFRESGGLLTISSNTVNDSEVDSLIVVLGPSGNPVIGDDDSGTDEDAAIRYRIPEIGVYTVLITHSIQGDTGQIDVSTIRITNQLKIGVQAGVFATSNDGTGILNAREYPGLGFTVVEELPSGSQVAIINGPYKDRDFVWWQVETASGQKGWVAEHIGGIQTLYPAIIVGESAQVNVPELNLRTDPNTSSERIRVLLIGEVLSVLEGPVDAEGFRWWKIRASNGDEGWTVEKVDDNRTLVAVVESG